MSFQYYTRPLEELQEISKVISTNFAELVGCTENSKLWSPPVAYKVCSELKVNGSNCSNISDSLLNFERIPIIRNTNRSMTAENVGESFSEPPEPDYSKPEASSSTNLSFLDYSFTSVVSSEMKSIWTRVLNYDVSVLNVETISSLKLSSNLDIVSKLKVCINQSSKYDSTIYKAIINNPNIWYTDDYKRLLWILLACYTIRYSVYDFSRGYTDTISTEQLNDNFLNSVVSNIEYEKYMLSISTLTSSEYDFSKEYISQQLSLLIKNIRQLKMYVLSYIR